MNTSTTDPGTTDPGTTDPGTTDPGTTDLSVLRSWWHRDPAAPVVLATGQCFDVVELPAGAGRLAMAALDLRGVRAGPVAVSARGPYWFFVSEGAEEELPALLDWLDWRGVRLDLRVHGRGGGVPAPQPVAGCGPASRTHPVARWLRDPSDPPGEIAQLASAFAECSLRAAVAAARQRTPDAGEVTQRWASW